MKGLAECTTYSFRIKSFRKTESTTDFSEYTAIKAATAVSGVKNAKVTSVTGSWITLEWAKNDKATGYSIEQYKGGKWVTVYTGTKATSTSYTVKSLKANTSYKFRIRAYKTYGNTKQYGSWSKVLTVKTKR